MIGNRQWNSQSISNGLLWKQASQKGWLATQKNQYHSYDVLCKGALTFDRRPVPMPREGRLERLEASDLSRVFNFASSLKKLGYSETWYKACIVKARVLGCQKIRAVSEHPTKAIGVEFL